MGGLEVREDKKNSWAVYNNMDKQYKTHNQITPNAPKLYHILYAAEYKDIPLEELTDYFCTLSREEFVSTNKDRLGITIQKLELQYSYDKFIIKEKIYE